MGCVEGGANHPSIYYSSTTSDSDKASSLTKTRNKDAKKGDDCHSLAIFINEEEDAGENGGHLRAFFSLLFFSLLGERDCRGAKVS